MAPEIVDSTEDTPWKNLERLLEAGDEEHLDEYIVSLSTADKIHAFSWLDPDMQAHLVLLVSPETAAGIFEDLPESQATALIERIDVSQAASIVAELSSDQGADILAHLEHTNAVAILDRMEPELANSVRQLIRYPDEVAGGLMGVEEYACNVSETIDDFLERLRANRV